MKLAAFTLFSLFALGHAMPTAVTGAFDDRVNVTELNEVAKTLPDEPISSAKSNVYGAISHIVKNAEHSDFVDIVHNYAAYLRKVKSASTAELKAHQKQWVQELAQTPILQKSAGAFSSLEPERAYGKYYAFKDWVRETSKELHKEVRIIEGTISDGTFIKDWEYLLRHFPYSIMHSKNLEDFNDKIFTASEYAALSTVAIIAVLGAAPVAAVGAVPAYFVHKFVSFFASLWKKC